MSVPDVTIVSVYATDRLYDEAGTWISNQEGGPCLFIIEAMQEQRISHFALAPAQKALVDIKLEKTGEVGTIKFTPSLEVDWGAINSPFVLISTVLDEVSLDNAKAYEGKICLDVQGFARKARTEGKTSWGVPASLYENCFCIKATEAELTYLPKHFIEKQKQSLLLVTRGAGGVEYWENGEHKEALPQEVVASSHAIGAGDTFFANFVAGLCRNQSVDVAIENSLRLTSLFLKRSCVP